MFFLVLVEQHNSKRWQKGLWSLTDCKVEKGWKGSRFHLPDMLLCSSTQAHTHWETEYIDKLNGTTSNEMRQRDKNLQRKFAGLLHTSQRAFPFFWDFPDVPVLAAWKPPPCRILICLMHGKYQYTACKTPKKEQKSNLRQTWKYFCACWIPRAAAIGLSEAERVPLAALPRKLLTAYCTFFCACRDILLALCCSSCLLGIFSVLMKEVGMLMMVMMLSPAGLVLSTDDKGTVWS